jgi:trimeric autotransporter adhesin
MSHSLSTRGVASSNCAARDASRSGRRRARTAVCRRRLAWLASCAFVAGTLGISTATPVMAGCNSGNDAHTDLLTSANCQAFASGGGATAIGAGATSGSVSTALGFEASARGALATAVGIGAGPGNAVEGTTNMGARSGQDGAGIYSTAIGAGNSDVIGAITGAQGNYSIAIGGGGVVFTPAIGPAINLNGAHADGFISIAIGTASQATGGGSSAFGLGSTASANDGAAYGEFSTASGASSVAIGLFSEANAASSIALGRKATALKSGSVAIGINSIATVANTVSVGRAGSERRIMNLAAGVKPTDAVNLAQVQAMLSAAPASAPPLLPQSSGGADATPIKDGSDIRRELTELRTLVREQQQRIAQLESRNVAAASTK